jgi:hypothetical protein
MGHKLKYEEANCSWGGSYLAWQLSASKQQLLTRPVPVLLTEDRLPQEIVQRFGHVINTRIFSVKTTSIFFKKREQCLADKGTHQATISVPAPAGGQSCCHELHMLTF